MIIAVMSSIVDVVVAMSSIVTVVVVVIMYD